MNKRHKKKRYFRARTSENDKNRLSVGMKGFILTCNFREKECIKEGFNLLNEYADKLYGSEEHDKTDLNSRIGHEMEDFDDLYNREIKELQEAKGNKSRFYLVNSFLKNCLFIGTTLPNPAELGSAILEDLESTKIQKTRNLIRMLPVQVICPIKIDAIKKLTKHLIEENFKEPVQFMVMVNRRLTIQLDRDEIIETFSNMVLEVNPLNRVNFKQPELCINVEVMKGVLCIGVLKNFLRYKKYNLIEVCIEKKRYFEDDPEEETSKNLPKMLKMDTSFAQEAKNKE